MPFVERTKDGKLTGVYNRLQPGYAEEYLEDDHAEIVAYRGAGLVLPVVSDEAEVKSDDK